MSEFKIGTGTTEDQLQQFFAYLVAQSSSGIATSGVLSGLSVAQTTTASADVLVNIGAAVTQSSLTAGADVLLNNAQKTLNVLTANPMGATPRNDLVVFDPADATIKLVVGTPNAIPTDPTPPTGAVSLARLSHLASATTVPTARITDLRVITTLAAAKSDLNKLGVTSSLAGMRVHRQSYVGGTTDANGFLTINHTAGFTPTLVTHHSTAPGASFAVPWGSDTYTGTQARLRFSDPRSTAPSSGAYASASTGAFYALFWE